MHAQLAELRDGVVRLGVVDGLGAVDPGADALAFRADQVVVPMPGFEDFVLEIAELIRVALIDEHHEWDAPAAIGPGIRGRLGRDRRHGQQFFDVREILKLDDFDGLVDVQSAE